MPATAPSVATNVRRSRAAQRAETRARILQAALDIIIDEGIRSVRNRAVAKRAGVSLGSTSYHFESIEHLIISAFQYWRERALLTENPFYRQISELLAPYQDSKVPGRKRSAIAREIFATSASYLDSQLSGKREDRLLELAFQLESIRYPSLHKLIMAEWQAQLEYLGFIHRVMGSTEPDVDARTTAALFRQLEQTTVISKLPEPDANMIRNVLHRHLTLTFGVDIPPTTGNNAI